MRALSVYRKPRKFSPTNSLQALVAVHCKPFKPEPPTEKPVNFLLLEGSMGPNAVNELFDKLDTERPSPRGVGFSFDGVSYRMFN